jgi:hypothetical protein
MPKKNATSERLSELEKRLSRIEDAFRRLPFPRFAFWLRCWPEAGERTVAPWKYLVRRPHPWRTQLYLQGRNMTARQLVGAIRANELNEEKASEHYRLPVEAIREAMTYVEESKQLLEYEAQIEQLMLKKESFSRAPQSVP